MKNKFLLITLSSLLLFGCSSPSMEKSDLSNPPTPPSEQTSSDSNEDNLIKPELEALYSSAEQVILAGPETEVTEDEFSQRVTALITELETTLKSDNYTGNEFLDTQLTNILNSSPERHEGMGPESYQEYYELVMPTAQNILNWEGMTDTTPEQ